MARNKGKQVVQVFLHMEVCLGVSIDWAMMRVFEQGANFCWMKHT